MIKKNQKPLFILLGTFRRTEGIQHCEKHRVVNDPEATTYAVGIGSAPIPGIETQYIGLDQVDFDSYWEDQESKERAVERAFHEMSDALLDETEIDPTDPIPVFEDEFEEEEEISEEERKYNEMIDLAEMRGDEQRLEAKERELIEKAEA